MSRVNYNIRFKYDINNTIENILEHDLPKYDYEFMDLIAHMTPERRTIHLAHFLYKVAIATVQLPVSRNNMNMIMYKEGIYSLYYGFNRCLKNKIAACIMINDDSPEENDGTLYNYPNKKTAFLVACEITPEQYNVIKNYILLKIKINIEPKYRRVIIHRLFGSITD